MNFVDNGYWPTSCRISDRLIYLIGGADHQIDFLSYPEEEPETSICLVGLNDSYNFVYDKFKMKEHRMYPACVFHNATKTIYILGGMRSIAPETEWV